MVGQQFNMGYRPAPPVTTTWQEHFAWKPVKVHGEWAWLKKVYRKRSKIRFTADGLIGTTWVYGTIFDVLSEPAPVPVDYDGQTTQGPMALQGGSCPIGPQGTQGDPPRFL